MSCLILVIWRQFTKISILDHMFSCLLSKVLCPTTRGKCFQENLLANFPFKICQPEMAFHRRTSLSLSSDQGVYETVLYPNLFREPQSGQFYQRRSSHRRSRSSGCVSSRNNDATDHNYDEDDSVNEDDGLDGDEAGETLTIRRWVLIALVLGWLKINTIVIVRYV